MEISIDKYRYIYNNMNNDNQNIPIRVSVSEASVLFGVSTKTIRQALKNNELLYIVARGRYRINFESLLNWSQKSTRRSNQFTNNGIGQYAEKWRIKTKKYSPSEELAKNIIAKHRQSETNINPASENQSDL